METVNNGYNSNRVQKGTPSKPWDDSNENHPSDEDRQDAVNNVVSTESCAAQGRQTEKMTVDSSDTDDLVAAEEERERQKEKTWFVATAAAAAAIERKIVKGSFMIRDSISEEDEVLRSIRVLEGKIAASRKALQEQKEIRTIEKDEKLQRVVELLLPAVSPQEKESSRDTTELPTTKGGKDPVDPEKASPKKATPANSQLAADSQVVTEAIAAPYRIDTPVGVHNKPAVVKEEDISASACVAWYTDIVSTLRQREERTIMIKDGGSGFDEIVHVPEPQRKFVPGELEYEYTSSESLSLYTSDGESYASVEEKLIIKKDENDATDEKEDFSASACVAFYKEMATAAAAQARHDIEKRSFMLMEGGTSLDKVINVEDDYHSSECIGWYSNLECLEADVKEKRKKEEDVDHDEDCSPTGCAIWYKDKIAATAARARLDIEKRNLMLKEEGACFDKVIDIEDDCHTSECIRWYSNMECLEMDFKEKRKEGGEDCSPNACAVWYKDKIAAAAARARLDIDKRDFLLKEWSSSLSKAINVEDDYHASECIEWYSKMGCFEADLKEKQKEDEDLSLAGCASWYMEKIAAAEEESQMEKKRLEIKDSMPTDQGRSTVPDTVFENNIKSVDADIDSILHYELKEDERRDYHVSECIEWYSDLDGLQRDVKEMLNENTNDCLAPGCMAWNLGGKDGGSIAAEEAEAKIIQEDLREDEDDDSGIKEEGEIDDFLASECIAWYSNMNCLEEGDRRYTWV